MAAIPVYAAVDHVHDHVVQAKGAFDETILGILKLKDRGQRVEIRIVLHALTAPIIEETCRWIARNLPFVDHVALMGLENTGFAIANDAMLWMDPIDYSEGLASAVEILDRYARQWRRWILKVLRALLQNGWDILNPCQNLATARVIVRRGNGKRFRQCRECLLDVKIWVASPARINFQFPAHAR